MSYSLSFSTAHKYNIIHVYHAQYESGGTMWRAIFHFIMTALLIFQLTMAGVLGAKGFGGNSYDQLNEGLTIHGYRKRRAACVARAFHRVLDLGVEKIQVGCTVWANRWRFSAYFAYTGRETHHPSIP